MISFDLKVMNSFITCKTAVEVAFIFEGLL